MKPLGQGYERAGRGIAESAQRRQQRGQEDVAPLIGFALDHPEQAPVHYLKRRGFQVGQDKQQPVFGCPQGTVLDCCVLAEERRTSSRHDWLLLGEQIAKDIFHPLSELEVLVRIQDHGLHEGLGLLTTRFPNGFDGQAPFPR